MADPKVSVLCTTYNQVDYLGQAIESFLAQETDFDFEIIIHDDCSTDGTTDLVRSYEERYPDKIRGMYEEENTYWTNGGRYFSRLMAPVARGTYVAFCEGDDYWCDPHKLQRQYDYLEANPDCSMCLCSSRVIDGLTGEPIGRMGPLGGDHDVSFDDLCLKWASRTDEGLWNPPMASMFMRREDCVAFYTDWNFKMPIADTSTCMHAASIGRVHYIDKDMCVYRYQAKGSWTSYSRRNLSGKKYNYLLSWYEEARIEMSRDIDRVTDGRFHDALEKDVATHVYRLAYTVGPFEFAKKYSGEFGSYMTPATWVKAVLVWIYIGIRRVLYHLGIELVDSPFTGMRVQRVRHLTTEKLSLERD